MTEALEFKPSEWVDNGAKWAEGFRKVVLDQGIQVDEDLMIGWFCNAIEISNAHRLRTVDASEAGQHRRFLWDLLDNIDTLDDACKGNDRAFRDKVRVQQRRRFEISSSDGFTVTFNEDTRPASPSREAIAKLMGFAARDRNDVSEDASEWWEYTGEAKRNELLKMADAILSLSPASPQRGGYQ